MASHTNTKLAVLIDADNAQSSKVGLLLAEITKYGTPHVKRAYGDWTGPSLKGWKEQLLRLSIQPIQQFAYTIGKNSTDAAMVIDAMDLLYTNRFDGFCIVSSDSDFTRLASRIRESGLIVYGFGERQTPKPFVAACDKFVYVENLSSLADGAPLADVAPLAEPVPVEPTPSTLARSDINLTTLLRAAITATSDDDGWAPLAVVGSVLTKRHSDFDPRSYGYDKLSDLITANPLFDVRRRVPGEGKPPVVDVRYRKRGF
ncbi:hypothetical protein GQ53DRAFT_745040 [Thozetella sp. PMI_491]|nr:hypothetical protein GQ53DRAFT_745040 [Thozetella sp. PMI_491]